MRRLMCAIVLVFMTMGTSGCFINQYSADPVRRYRQLFYESENLRLLEDELERFWMLDRPSNLSLKRYHGEADPAARPRF